VLPAAGSAASVAAGVAALGAVCYFVYKAQWQASPTSSYQFPFLAFTSIERQQQLVNATKGSDSNFPPNETPYQGRKTNTNSSQITD